MSLPPETPIEFLPEESLDVAKGLIQAEFEADYEDKVVSLISKGHSKEDAEVSYP